MEVKVPVGLSGFICKMREKRISYSTNRAFAGYSIWLLLKTKTKSGVIQDLEHQLPKLLKLTKLSRSSFYRHLNYASELGLIKTSRKNSSKITLTSYKKIQTEFILINKFIAVKYELKNKTSFSNILKSLEYKEAFEKMETGYKNAVNKTPSIRQAFKIQAEKEGIPDLEFNQENLLKLQIKAFQTGGAAVVYHYLFLVNPDFNRKLKTIAEKRNFFTGEKLDKLVKQNAYYEIQVLKKFGLLQVQNRPSIECTYKKDFIGDTRGKAPNRSRTYSKKGSVSVWNFTNSITFLNS